MLMLYLRFVKYFALLSSVFIYVDKEEVKTTTFSQEQKSVFKLKNI